MTREAAWRDQLSQEELDIADRVQAMEPQMAISWIAVELFRLRGVVTVAADTTQQAATAAEMAAKNAAEQLVKNPAKGPGVLSNALGTGIGGALILGAYIALKLLHVI